MLLDSQNCFSDKQAVTASAASENVVKMSDGFLNEVSFGQPIPLNIQVVEDFAELTSLKVGVQTSDTEDFESPETLVESAAVALANLKAGYKFPIIFVPKGNKGYMRLYYTVAGTGTAGKITAGVAAAHDNSYQDM